MGSPLHCALVTDVVVDVQHDDGVRTLTLNSPANRNALSERLLAQLEQAVRDATTDPDVRAIVLTGTGTVFCSGADLSERGTAAPNRMPAILTSMVESAVPIIVRVNGHARAGGIGLVAAADMAVATTDATFAFTEVAGSTTRQLDGELVVRVPGVGRMAERRIVPGIVRRLDIEARAVDQRLAVTD